jgi:hypothetical protein
MLTITLSSFGQNSNVDSLEKQLLLQIENVLERKSVEDLQKFKKTICPTRNELSQDEKTKLVTAFYHNLVRIQIEYRIDASTTSYYGYDISLINYDNEIIYYKILDLDSAQKTSYKNLSKLKELQNSYLHFYFDLLKIEDLEINKKHIYGASCGFGGETLNERTEMENHLSRKDVTFFNSWISNPNIELKAYAYEAFRRLEKQGLQLTEKHINILQYLENDNSYVKTCEGCIIERIQMKELIKTIKR